MKHFLSIVLMSSAISFAALSEEVRDNFIGSCEEGGSSPAFCGCVFGKVEQKYSQAQIDAIELKMRRGHADMGYTNFVKKASQECDAKLKSGSSLGALAASEDVQNSQAQKASTPQTSTGSNAKASNAMAFSAEDLAALEALGVDADFAQGVVSALLESPEYKNIFLADCAVEIRPYFGNRQAASTCECAYQKVIANGGVEKLMSLVNQNGELNDSLALEMILPCMPKQYTAEMEKFLMDSCTTVASKEICSCVVRDVKKHFTLEELLRRTVANPTFIQGYVTGAAMRCKEY